MTRIREENRQSRSFEIFLTVKLGIYLGVSEIGEFYYTTKCLEIFQRMLRTNQSSQLNQTRLIDDTDFLDLKLVSDTKTKDLFKID